jgi:hypothetical protein
MEPIKNSYTLNIVKRTTDQNEFGNGWGFYVDIENVKNTLPKYYGINRKKYKITINKNYNEFENELDYYISLNKDIADENNENNEISNNFMVNIIIIVIITYAILNIS